MGGRGLVSRILLLAGAAGLALAAVLPWVTIKGLGLELGPIGAEVSPGARTVNGTDTSLWPVVLGVGAIVVVLAPPEHRAQGPARRSASSRSPAAARCCTTSRTSSRSSPATSSQIEKLLTSALVSSSVGPGAPLLIAGGIAIVTGALLAR